MQSAAIIGRIFLKQVLKYLLDQGSHEADVEEQYKQAIEVVRQLGAKSLELRAVMSLRHLWQKQGKRAQSRQIFEEIYSWFTEGFKTADLLEAKTLLDEIIDRQVHPVQAMHCIIPQFITH